MFTRSNDRFSTVARSSALAALMITTSVSAAFAVPAAVDPGQVQKRFEQPRGQAPIAPSVTLAPGSDSSSKMSAEMARKRFVLKSVSIDGNKTFSNDALKSLYADKLGKEISMLDAQGIVKSITNKYRSHGYMLSQASMASRDVSGGNLKIRVTEGYISKVSVQGDVRGEYNQVVQSYAEHLKSLRPVTMHDVERFLLLVDDLPGASAKGMVRPAGGAGATELVVNVAHKTFEASYSIDNRGSKFIGPVQHTGVFAANSLLGLYDRTVVRAITASPVTELQFFDLLHELPIGNDGTKLGLVGSYSETHPGSTLTTSDIDGQSEYFQARVSHPFLRSRKENLGGRLAFDMRHTEIETADVLTSDDRLRTVRLGGNYDFADGFGGANLADLELSKGLNIFNASENGTQRSRTDGESDFTKLNLDLGRTQALPSDLSLFAGLSGQVAFDRLLVAEQFSLGGVGYGRGYNPSELSGDHALAGKLELRWNNYPAQTGLQAYQVYGFYDAGKVWLKDTVNGANSLSSTGLGVRAEFTDNFSGNVEMAVPLTRDVSDQGRHGDDPRVFFGFTGKL